MLQHHLGGIHMVEGLLAEGPTPTSKVAQTMKNTQQTDLTNLQRR